MKDKRGKSLKYGIITYWFILWMTSKNIVITGYDNYEQLFCCQKSISLWNKNVIHTCYQIDQFL